MYILKCSISFIRFCTLHNYGIQVMEFIVSKVNHYSHLMLIGKYMFVWCNKCNFGHEFSPGLKMPMPSLQLASFIVYEFWLLFTGEIRSSIILPTIYSQHYPSKVKVIIIKTNNDYVHVRVYLLGSRIL